ncbi:MAG: hypothetical protein PHE56_00610 [Bacteroidales bacterium]|nr:hypothetical protein [Bacteroidales bacterium]
MKNKKSLYILIPAVAIIWGLIAFKIFTYNDENVEIPIVKPVTESKKQNIVKEAHIINTNYPDPFLKSRTYSPPSKLETTQQVNKKENTTTQVKPVAVTNKDIKWPPISFDGMVVNNTSGEKTAIITVSGKRKLLDYNDEINGIRLSALFQDSVVLILNSNFKTFYRNK